MKQTFNIPDGCSTVTVEQVGNQLITTFEPEKYVPKKGDCIKFGDGFAKCLSEPTNIDEFTFCADFGNWKPKTQNYIVHDFDNIEVCFPVENLTQEQFQSEFEKLGYFYDFETNTASKKIFRAKHGDYYFKLDSYFNPMKLQEFNDKSDALNYFNFNYFRTEEIAINAAKFLINKLKEFNNK